MNPEIWAKIREIVNKTGEKIVIVDPDGGEPLILMGLAVYEKLINQVNQDKTGVIVAPQGDYLTPREPFGIIDPDSALLKERQHTALQDWGGDEEEDRYYMEPAE
ncbi:hypothetical protein HY477_02655 [Candidatus Uhrbacteria bacterium]|nr:hypothetical protein [Candidatus Uhrbacteria bacterium]